MKELKLSYNVGEETLIYYMCTDYGTLSPLDPKPYVPYTYPIHNPCGDLIQLTLTATQNKDGTGSSFEVAPRLAKLHKVSGSGFGLRV